MIVAVHGRHNAISLEISQTTRLDIFLPWSAPGPRSRQATLLMPARAGARDGGPLRNDHSATQFILGQTPGANLTGLVLGCIEAKFCKKICV